MEKLRSAMSVVWEITQTGVADMNVFAFLPLFFINRPLYRFPHFKCSSSRGSLRFYDYKHPPENATIPRRSWRNRVDRNQNVNLPRPYARQPQPSADKNIRRTAENDSLDCTSGKVILTTTERQRDHYQASFSCVLKKISVCWRSIQDAAKK